VGLVKLFQSLFLKLALAPKKMKSFFNTEQSRYFNSNPGDKPLQQTMDQLADVATFALYAQAPLKPGIKAQRFQMALETLWFRMHYIDTYEAAAILEAFVKTHDPKKSSRENVILLCRHAAPKIGKQRVALIMHWCGQLAHRIHLIQPTKPL